MLKRVLHAYKVCHVEIYGGIPEAIQILTRAPRPDFTNSLLAARLRGPGRHFADGSVKVRLTGSFGTVASTPLAPTYPFELVRAARDADVLALHAPFPLSDMGVLLGIPQRVALIVHWHAEFPRTRLLARPVASLVQATL